MIPSRTWREICKGRIQTSIQKFGKDTDVKLQILTEIGMSSLKQKLFLVSILSKTEKFPR